MNLLIDLKSQLFSLAAGSRTSAGVKNIHILLYYISRFKSFLQNGNIIIEVAVVPDYTFIYNTSKKEEYPKK